jgi:hypothetical protein
MSVIRNEQGEAVALGFGASEIGRRRKPRVEREHGEQVALVTWARYESGRMPELALLFAIPNAGKRSRGAGGKLRAEGMKAGVPDLCLPVARGGYHGLFIELKAKGGRPTDEQKAWLRALTCQGYYACICVGWEAAKKRVEEYLRGAQ